MSSQGNHARARALLEESMATFKELGDKSGAANWLYNLGIGADEQGDPARARSLFEESLALMREVENKGGIAMVLLSLGELARKEGDEATARTCLVESLTRLKQLGDRRFTPQAVEAFGLLARAQQQPERPVRLFGAVDTMRESTGARLSPEGRQEFERDLADLHAMLGEDTFNMAWAAGRAMPWEQAIEYALEENPVVEDGRNTETGGVH